MSIILIVAPGVCAGQAAVSTNAQSAPTHHRRLPPSSRNKHRAVLLLRREFTRVTGGGLASSAQAAGEEGHSTADADPVGRCETTVAGAFGQSNEYIVGV